MLLTDPQSWTLQILILGTGIYLFLRFLRTTRGSGLLRGLTVAFLVGAIGLWGLSKYLELEELGHIIQGVIPYVAVILTIIFQPELRRAMARLGQQNRFAQLLSSGQKDSLSRVANASVAMASRRHGALIAFQQDTPLDAWTSNAQHIDAEISATLLESIFHPGSALHDGAVVIVDDRIVAGACLFPLSENIALSKSTGTRHRAAIGLTEETDAVTLTVSEETGQISIARQGFMNRDIPPADLEQNLRDALGIARPDQAQDRPALERLVHGLKEFFTTDLLRKVSSVALASGMVYLAHQDIVSSRDYRLRIVEVASARRIEPQAGLLRIRMPDDSFHLASQPTNELRVEVSGTQAQLDRLASLGGVFDVPADSPEGPFELRIDGISWVQGTAGLDFTWKDASVPRFELERFSTHTLELSPQNVTVDATNIDLHFTARIEELEIGQSSITIEGPRRAIDAIRDGSMAFELQPIVLQDTDRQSRKDLLGVAESMTVQRVSIVSGERVAVTLPIVPQPVALGELERDLAVVNLRPDTSTLDPNSFAIDQSAQKIRFELNSAGVFDSPAGSDAYLQTRRQIREFAAEHLKAYVDVSELTEAGGVAPIYWDFPDDWKEQLFPGSDLDAAARLDVVLKGELTVLLTPK